MLANSPAGQKRSLADVLWALGSAETLGEATMRTRTQLRSNDNRIVSLYKLLGDPDSASGSRWPDFARLEQPALGRRQNGKVAISLTLPGSSCFADSEQPLQRKFLFVSSPDSKSEIDISAAIRSILRWL